MESNEFLRDKGLFLTQNDFNFLLPDSFESIANCLRTIKEYRDYAHPDTQEWREYIHEIFHVLGFQTEQKAPRLISLRDIGADSSPEALVLLVSTGENLEEIIPGLDWLTYLYYAAHYYQVDWGFLTNGFELKAFDFRRKDFRKIYFWANLDGIINESRLDSFFTIYKIFTNVRGRKGKMAVPKSSGQPKGKKTAKRYNLRKEFWRQLLEKARKKTHLHANISPGKDNWISTGAGLSWVGFNYVIRMNDAQVELYINKKEKKQNKQLFDQIYAGKKRVEDIFGEPLDWQRLDDRQASRVRYQIPGLGLLDKEQWPELQDRMIDAMIRLEKALRPEIISIGGRAAQTFVAMGDTTFHLSTGLFPLAIHATHKGQIHEAELLDMQGTIRWNGRNYRTPTAAAKAVTQWRTVNGWTFWRYDDPQTGRARRITELRTII